MIAEAKRLLDDAALAPAALLDSLTPALLPGPRCVYQRSAAAVDVRAADADASTWQVRVSDAQLGRTDIDIPEELVPLCQWVASQERSFGDRDLLASATGLQRLDVQQVLGAFLESGALVMVASEASA